MKTPRDACDAGIIVSMGGQTALNVGIELWRNEDLQRRGIRVLGTKIDAIVATEDREIFSTKLRCGVSVENELELADIASTASTRPRESYFVRRWRLHETTATPSTRPRESSRPREATG